MKISFCTCKTRGTYANESSVGTGALEALRNAMNNLQIDPSSLQFSITRKNDDIQKQTTNTINILKKAISNGNLPNGQRQKITQVLHYLEKRTKNDNDYSTTKQKEENDYKECLNDTAGTLQHKETL